VPRSGFKMWTRKGRDGSVWLVHEWLKYFGCNKDLTHQLEILVAVKKNGEWVRLRDPGRRGDPRAAL